MRRIVLSPLLILLLSGCSSLLTTRLAAPVYYQLDYAPAPVACGHSFADGVRVMDFTTATPFDRPEMVATGRGGKVRYSSGFQWVDTPGRMLAEDLERDLSAGSLFPLVAGGNTSLNLPLELTGRVFRFAWLKQGEDFRAELRVEVRLLATGPPLRVLFHRTYELKGPVRRKGGSALFAAGMSALTGRLSEQLRRDLCAAAGRYAK